MNAAEGPDAIVASRAVHRLSLVAPADVATAELSEMAVRHRLQSGRWERKRRGIYAIAGVRATFEQEVEAARLAHGAEALVTGPPGARVWDMPGRHDGDGIHLLTLTPGKARGPGVVTRRSKVIVPADRARRRGVTVTSWSRTFIENSARRDLSDRQLGRSPTTSARVSPRPECPQTVPRHTEFGHSLPGKAVVMERRRVLVTGANSGLGLAITIEAARRGYEAIGSVRSEEKAKPLHDAAAEAGVEVDHVLLDVTDAERCQEVVEEVGPLYGLVNNAGGGGTGAVEDVGDDEARATLEAMLVAPIRLARLVAPGMRTLGSGRIVNISSVYGKASTPLTGWYQAAKHGLEGVSDALRMELARDRIAVVLVEPGAFRTNIFNEAEANMGARQTSAYRGAYERSAQLMRLSEPFMGNPGQVAKVVGKALDTRNPRDRYLVGLDAQAFDLAWRFTPRPILDRVTRLTAGL